MPTKPGFAARTPEPDTKLLALIEWCCDVARKHIENGNYGWAEFTMARAQQAAEAYKTLQEARVDGSEAVTAATGCCLQPKLDRLREDYERLEKWAAGQNAGNAFATQVAYYARARLAEWDEPIERWEP